MSAGDSQNESAEAEASRREKVSEREIAGDPPRDGIAEHDNAIPLWFNIGFYGMIVYGILYLLYYLFSGWSQAGQYDAEVARFNERFPPIVAESVSSNPFRGDAAAIAEGEKVFMTICSVCHKPDGTGLVGPSLVDPYWKYGDDDAALFESVANGRPAGMPGWLAQLGQDQVWQSLAYVETLPRQSEPGVGAPAPAAEDGGGS